MKEPLLLNCLALLFNNTCGVRLHLPVHIRVIAFTRGAQRGHIFLNRLQGSCDALFIFCGRWWFGRHCLGRNAYLDFQNLLVESWGVQLSN